MTVIIGLNCTDGVLLASDSMGSSGKIATTVPKARIMKGHPIIWGMSGSAFVIQQTEHAVQKLERNGQAKPTAQKLAQKVRETIIEAQEIPVTPPGGDERDRQRHISEALILDWTPKTAGSIIHIPDDLAPMDCRNRPFVAIGSGHEFAATIYETLSHHLSEPLRLDQACLFAYRAIATVCRVSSWGVGLPVQIAIANSQGAKLLGSQELEQLEDGVQRWLASDAENFRTEGSPQPAGRLPQIRKAPVSAKVG